MQPGCGHGVYAAIHVVEENGQILVLEDMLGLGQRVPKFVKKYAELGPAIEEAVLRKLGESARHNGDTLLGLLTDAQLIDASRHRRWLAALVRMASETPGNLELIQGWIAKWEPLADKAIDAYCSALPDVPDAAAVAKAATREFRRNLGL